MKELHPAHTVNHYSLAVQNSSIGDLVTHWMTHWPTFVFLTLKSDPKDLWPLRHWWQFLMTIFDDNFRWQFLMTIFDDIFWWQLLMTIFDDNFLWQFFMTTFYGNFYDNFYENFSWQFFMTIFDDLWYLRHWLQYWQLRTWFHDNLC